MVIRAYVFCTAMYPGSLDRNLVSICAAFRSAVDIKCHRAGGKPGDRWATSETENLLHRLSTLFQSRMVLQFSILASAVEALNERRRKLRSRELPDLYLWSVKLFRMAFQHLFNGSIHHVQFRLL